jgi:hypothetical protein
VYSVSIGAFVRPYGAITDVKECLVFDVDSLPNEDAEPFRAMGDPAIAARVQWQTCID